MPGTVGQAPALSIAMQHEAFVTGEPHGRPVGKREHLRSHPSPLDCGLGAPNHCGERAEMGEVGLAAALAQGQRGSQVWRGRAALPDALCISFTLKCEN